MKNVIESQSGKKEGIVICTMLDGYRASIFQVINTGIGFEKDFITSKQNFKTREAAVKWILKNINN